MGTNGSKVLFSQRWNFSLDVSGRASWRLVTANIGTTPTRRFDCSDFIAASSDGFALAGVGVVLELSSVVGGVALCWASASALEKQSKPKVVRNRIQNRF